MKKILAITLVSMVAGFAKAAEKRIIMQREFVSARETAEYECSVYEQDGKYTLDHERDGERIGNLKAIQLQPSDLKMIDEAVAMKGAKVETIVPVSKNVSTGDFTTFGQTGRVRYHVRDEALRLILQASVNASSIKGKTSGPSVLVLTRGYDKAQILARRIDKLCSQVK